MYSIITRHLAPSQNNYDHHQIIYMKPKIIIMKALYDQVEITMNSIALNKFNVNYGDLTDEQVKVVHKIYFAQ